ncbi:hypothetical protein ACX80U_12070 [Arthrobacter sp. TmT3-37]
MENEPVFSDPYTFLRPVLDARLTAKLGRRVHIGTKVPNPRKTEFIRLVLTGGSRKNVITESPTIAIEVWAIDSTEALRIAKLASAIIHSLAGELIDGVQVGEVGAFGLPQDLPDEDSTHARFTATYSIDLSFTDTL